MPRNHIFTFKQFDINQDKTAMKVCTDACILGAWANCKDSTKILDIGAGTGLLSLMMAQRSKAKIHAVEIEENAYKQAVQNVENSPFSTQIEIYNTDILNYFPEKNNFYDLIISNPPFYQNSLQSPDNQTNKAHHSVSLSFSELIFSVKRLMAQNGKFIVLLPPFESSQLEKIANQSNLFLTEKLKIRHSEKRDFFREISVYQHEIKKEITENVFEVYESDEKTYSKVFQVLLKDYYLIF